MKRPGQIIRILRYIGLLAVLVAVAYTILLSFIWNNRVELKMASAALSEQRTIMLFGAHEGGQKDQVAIYSLDGNKFRHSLLPATHGAVLAWLTGETAPLVIAVYDHGKRDIDFRPVKVSPAYWRPKITGRGPAFDQFLLNELRPLVEQRFGSPKERYLFGHSLAGFYAIDMAARKSSHGFKGLYAFSPTFSHDLSILNRLEVACANSASIYANIGLESDRDTEVFGKAEEAFVSAPICRSKGKLTRHPGMIHAVVMITGQIEAFFQIYAGT